MSTLRSSEAGFTLTEICVAMTLLMLASTGVAQLCSVAVAATYVARVQTATTVFAGQKVEALRALAWTDPALSQTVSDALDSNVSGSVEHLDTRGVVVSTNATAPATGRFIRRWCIRPLPEDSNALIVQVLVTTPEAERSATRPRRRMAGDALVTTIITRLGR